MKNHFQLLIITVFACFFFASCDDYETYAEQKDKERESVAAFISKHHIKVISESVFQQQNYTTNVDENEYVLFENTGVYMQIRNAGCGEVLKDGESARVLSRFDEYNVLGDSLQLSNKTLSLHYLVDKYDVRNVSGTFYASFIQGASFMASCYGSNSVPAGWLVPLTYIKLGRPSAEGENIADVRLIVPHDQGHSFASSGVYACYYEITYQRGI